MGYELYPPDGSCDRVLPLNPVQHRMSFYRIQVFDLTLKLDEYIDKLSDDYIGHGAHVDRDTKSMRMGLPISHLFPSLRRSYAEVRLDNDGQVPIKFGLDDIFLPFDRKAAAADPIGSVRAASSTDGTDVTIDGKSIALSSAQQKILAEQRQVFVRHDGGVLRVTAPEPAATDATSSPPVEARGLFSSKPTAGGPVATPRLRQPSHHGKHLPAYEIGLFTTYEQLWDLKGYSRGSLVNAITLAPQEELSIEVFTWDRLKTDEERTQSTEIEKNLETSSLARLSTHVATDLSETTDTSGDVGLGVTLPVEGVPVKIDSSGHASQNVKTGIQATVDQIHEATQRASERVKSTQQVKVVQTHEVGREDRTIRKIRNANTSRTLTMNYFEVLENYSVTTKLVATKQFCVLVANPNLGPIDVPFVLAYEDRLQRCLLSTNYLPGFEAALKLAAQSWFEAAQLKAEIDEANNQSIGAAADSSPPVKPIVAAAFALKDCLQTLLDADLTKAATTLSDYYNPLGDHSVTEDKRADAEAVLGLFNYWLKFKMIAPGAETKARAFVAGVKKSPPSSEADIVNALESFLAGMDDDWVVNLKMLAANLVAIQLSSLLIVPFPLLTPVLLELAAIENNNGLPALIQKAKQQLKSYEVVAGAQLPNGTGANAKEAPKKEPPPQIYSLQELAEAYAAFQKLKLHIAANRVYYLNHIWRAEDADARFQRLRTKGLDSFVVNRLLGFVGDKSVFPLRLESLDASVLSILQNKIASFDPDAIDTIDGQDYGKITVSTSEIDLPTPALYMETSLGVCEGLEPFLIDHRNIDRDRALIELAIQNERLEQKKQETARLKARLAASPPVLDDPHHEDMEPRP